MRAWLYLTVFAMTLAGAPDAHADSTPGHVTGVGGIFVRSPNPKALSAWYADMLGIKIESWGGAMLPTDAPGHPKVVVWTAFKQSTDHFDPSTREFMVNFAVDDLDAMIAKLTAKGVKILGKSEPDPTGTFAWILDPDGTKIELWQAAKK